MRIWIGGMMMLLLSGLSFAAQDVKHLKCWVQTVEGDYRLVNYLFENERLSLADDPELFALSLKGKSIDKLDGVNSVEIAEAKECVPLDTPFSDPAARRMDSLLPR